MYPNLIHWRVISNESRLLFIVLKIGLREYGIKQIYRFLATGSFYSY
ncbi:hypothetical protein ACV3R2_15440 [Clostridium perfringens]